MGIWDLLTGGDQAPLVRAAQKDVASMLEDGERMFAAATALLLDNEALEIDLHAVDENINDCEQHLRTAVLEHLAMDPNRDLVFSLKLISIVHEAERIGDLAKSLAKVAGLAERPRMGERVAYLRSLRDQVLSMFEAARSSFRESDPDTAHRLMREHEKMKDDVAEFLEAVAHDEALSSNEGIVLALSVRMINRISSHLSNIASTVSAPFDQLRRASTWVREG